MKSEVVLIIFAYLFIIIVLGFLIYSIIKLIQKDITEENRHNEQNSSNPNNMTTISVSSRNNLINTNRVSERGPSANQPISNNTQRITTETGPMIYFANDRHDSNDKEFQFNFRKVEDGWRAYILRTPSFCGRDTDCTITHRLHDDNGYYVCWDRPIDNLKDMQTISRTWADLIMEYIATGKRFS